MPSLYLIVLLALSLVVLIALVALPSVRSSATSLLDRLRRRLFPPPLPPAHTGVTIIAGNGDEIPITATQPMSIAARIEAAGGHQRLLVLALVGLLTLVAAWQLYRFTSAPPAEQFVVLVAPFSEPGGVVGQTGREVAASLVAALPEASGRRVVARAISAPPASPAEALATLGREGADALVWGEITAGGMLDRETLQPRLAYRPSGPFAPLAWQGYAQRFAMPGDFTIANRPIYGAVVLPALLGALADYGSGHFDSAFETLGQLLDQQSALVPTLPRALRGNILWARANYPAAIGEYQAALRPLSGDPRAAPLLNNLGAIELDAGNADASQQFSAAISALAGGDLAALRYNLALQSLQAGTPAQAATSLESARSLIEGSGAPVPGSLLLTLAAAYRENGQFDQAAALIDSAERQESFDTAATTADARNIVSARLSADATYQRALLQLARAAQARGPLLWELIGSDALPANQLDSARDQLSQAADDTAVLAQLWTRLATAKDAAGEQIAGQVATSQAQQAQARWRERQRWLALVELERGSAPGVRQASGIASIWAALTGDRTPLGRGRAILAELLQSQPSDAEALLLLGNSQLIAGQTDEAQVQFARAASLAPDRPEPVYGQALATLPSDRPGAKQLLAKAVTIQPGFFPARQRLATLAEEDRDWPAVIEQRRWFAQNRPSVANTLALAAALQQSGPAGFAEAERMLLPLANQSNTSAMAALSELYQASGDADGARQVLERAQRAAPRDATVAYQYGQLLERQGNPSGALAAYQRAIEINAASVPARLALGRLFAARGQPAEAGQQYQVALRAGANDPAELRRIGDVLLQNGEYDQAATAYERAIAAIDSGASTASAAEQSDTRDPNAELASLYHGLGQANLLRGQLEPAQVAEQRALELSNGSRAEVLLGLGDIALQRGDPRLAADQYAAALAINSKLVGAHIGLGRAAGAQGNWAVAQAHFRDALATDDQSAEAHLWMGEALIRQQNPTAAIEAYVSALKLRDNRYPEAYFGLAQAQIAAGRTDLAKDNLAIALQLKPSYPEALLLQGKLYEQLGDTRAAREAYTRAIDASDTLAEPYYRRALLSARAEQFDTAADDLEAAIEIQPNFSEAHYWLGRAYLAQGSPRTARVQFAEAITQRGGNFPDARFYQGVSEEQLGQRNDAVQSYQAALEQAGTSEWAGEAQAALNRLRQP